MDEGEIGCSVLNCCVSIFVVDVECGELSVCTFVEGWDVEVVVLACVVWRED